MKEWGTNRKCQNLKKLYMGAFNSKSYTFFLFLFRKYEIYQTCSFETNREYQKKVFNSKKNRIVNSETKLKKKLKT